MDFPTEILTYLRAFVRKAEVTSGADRAACKRAVKELEPLLLRLPRNSYQEQLIKGAVSAITKYLKQEGSNDRSQRYLVFHGSCSS